MAHCLTTLRVKSMTMLWCRWQCCEIDDSVATSMTILPHHNTDKVAKPMTMSRSPLTPTSLLIAPLTDDDVAMSMAMLWNHDNFATPIRMSMLRNRWQSWETDDNVAMSMAVFRNRWQLCDNDDNVNVASRWQSCEIDDNVPMSMTTLSRRFNWFNVAKSMTMLRRPWQCREMDDNLWNQCAPAPFPSPLLIEIDDNVAMLMPMLRWQCFVNGMDNVVKSTYLCATFNQLSSMTLLRCRWQCCEMDDNVCEIDLPPPHTPPDFESHYWSMTLRRRSQCDDVGDNAAKTMTGLRCRWQCWEVDEIDLPPLHPPPHFLNNRRHCCDVNDQVATWMTRC